MRATQHKAPAVLALVLAAGAAAHAAALPPGGEAGVLLPHRPLLAQLIRLDDETKRCARQLRARSLELRAHSGATQVAAHTALHSR